MMDLKSCPFCGGEAAFLVKCHSERGIARGWEFGVYCKKCDVTTPKTDYRLEMRLNEHREIETIVDERLLAITTWNRRIKNELD